MSIHTISSIPASFALKINQPIIHFSNNLTTAGIEIYFFLYLSEAIIHLYKIKINVHGGDNNEMVILLFSQQI